MPVNRDRFWLRSRCDGVAIALQALEEAIDAGRDFDAYEAACVLSAHARALARLWKSAVAEQLRGDVEIPANAIVDHVRGKSTKKGT